MDVFDSMMYTKEGEFDVCLTGGSPWGFTIRTQAGNGLYNRGKVIVAKVVQGGKADSSGEIHVGDEILTVNGLEFDNEEQATEYVKDAQKELILRVKRGQDKRRMNIRLAGELPNYFAKALESPFEKNVYTSHNTDANMVSNNKRSSKEYEKDLSYSFSSNTVNAVIDYPSGALSQLNVTRLTKSTADLSEYTRPKKQAFKDNLSRSPPWKNYHPPGSPDKVQRVRITSTNVSENYKYAPDRLSPTFFVDDNLRQSDCRLSTPGGYSSSAQKPAFNSSAMDDLNRTWPSTSNSDVSVKDSRRAAFSVSVAKSHFEQMSRDHEHGQESDKRSSLSATLAPKPPSRNSSFRSARLSSSSSVFTDTTLSSNIDRQKSQEYIPSRKTSSADDLDKPQPPKRFSQSAVLNSFRSTKKPGYVPKSTAPSTVFDQQENVVYHHARTQSLPSSKIAATHLSSKTWAMNDREEDTHNEERLPRSSSFSRARVIETSNVKSVHRKPEASLETRASRRSDSPVEVTVKTVQIEDTKVPNYAAKIDVKHSCNPNQTKVIQALRTGEVASKIGNTETRGSPKQNEQRSNCHKWSKQEYSTPDQYRTERVKPEALKPNSCKPEVQPKSILKRETSKPEPKPRVSKPAVLKENSLMQRLLMESQGHGGSTERFTAAAIEEEINQRTGKTSIRPTSRSSVDVIKIENTEQRSEFACADYKAKENRKAEESKQENVNKEGKVHDKLSEASQDDLSSNVEGSTSKVDNYFDKLMGKLDSPPVKQRSLPQHKVLQKVDSLGDDNVFAEPVDTKSSEQEDEPIESNIDDNEEVEISNQERNAPSSELIVKSVTREAVLESHPSHLSDNIAERITPEKTEPQHQMKKPAETKFSDTLSPADGPVKIIHSRENSASSLLEETLESAKTIASIYSVEGPSRSPDGEDSLSTASEMRRHSLAKRVRRRPKLESSTFTPERDQSMSQEQTSFSEPAQNEGDIENGGNRSTGSVSSGGSRPDSGILSPKLEALEEQKEILISSMKKKVALLKEQESEINEEMKQNDELGRRVAKEVKERTSGAEFSKYELFVGELNNIIGLLLSLTQRMHRYEVLLQEIDLAEENGRDKRDVLLKRIDRVKQQYEEACRIKEINDKRGETVSKIVEDYCSDEDCADFQHFVDMKTQLALTQAEIRDKIKLGEEKLTALTSAHIDWTTLDLSLK